MRDQPGGGTRRRQRAVDRQQRDETLAVDAVAETLGQERAQRVEPVGGDREAGGHRVPAAIDQQPGLPRRDHRRAERHARHRTARSFPHSVRHRDDAGRPLVAFLEPRRDDADDPGVPALRRREHQSGRLRAGLDRRDRRLQRLGLDRAALAVVGVESRCQLRGFLRVVGGEQPGAEIGGADPAAGIDPGPEHEAEMVGVDRFGHAADRGQRAQPGIAALPRDPDALRDKRAVDPGQRDDVAHRAERDQIEPLQQVGFGPLGVPAGLAQRPVDGDGQQEGDPDRGERSVRASLVERGSD